METRLCSNRPRRAPVSGGLLLAEIFEEAGFPPGVFNVITHTKEDAPEVGDELIVHPAVRRISFTGSTEVGRIVAEKAGRNLKRAVMELGGKDPLIILRDADVDFAPMQLPGVRSCTRARSACPPSASSWNARSRRSSSRNLALARNALKVGDPRDPSVAIGPLINQAALDKGRRSCQGSGQGWCGMVCGR
jgi:aldehyde dehydrogenase (NAD+)